MIRIQHVESQFEREPLASPFGFKGGYLSELWQSVAFVKSQNGTEGVGLGTQSTLWSDPSIFLSYSSSAGNSLMYLMTERALKIVKETGFENPMQFLDDVLNEVYEYGKKISDRSDLRKTFALNALVAVDHALWLVYARETGNTTFSSMISREFSSILSHEQEKLAMIPLISYGVSVTDIEKLINEGCFFLKIKIGADPAKDGDLEKMLEWDKQRLTQIHNLAKDREIQWTVNGKIPYYLDANGRYDSKDRLMRLLDHAKRIRALDQIILMEEPFPEELKLDVRDVPVRLAADESAHSEQDVLERIELGYGAIALKPIAKTLSMSLKMAKVASEKGIPCFCADLTVNPILVEWNKNVASKLKTLPGMKVGVLESNGAQNYKNWSKLMERHPCGNRPWAGPQNGFFELDHEFYAQSGGIFETSKHYRQLFNL